MREQRAGQGEMPEPMKTAAKGNGSKVKGRKFTKDHFVELSVLVAFIVQQRGEASIQDVQKAIKDNLNSNVHQSTLSKVLEALKSRDLLAAIFRQDERVYKMKRIKFNCNVEVAHVQKLIPTLMDDPAGIAVKAEIEGHLNESKKDGGKGRNLAKEWADYEVTFKLLTPWYGSQVLAGNQLLGRAYAQSKFPKTFDPNIDPALTPLLFERDWETGGILVHCACVKGFFREHLSKIDQSPWNVDLFMPQPIIHMPKEITIARLPIQRPKGSGGFQGSGAGFGHYEAILPGEVLTLRFAAPTVNFISPAMMKRWLTRCLRSPVRSMSPARGSQTGSAQLLELKHELWSEMDKEILEAEKKAGGNGAGSNGG